LARDPDRPIGLIGGIGPFIAPRHLLNLEHFL
jgi:hypothetical protein